jgi:hypothetical protein
MMEKLFGRMKLEKNGDQMITHTCILLKEIYDNVFTDKIGRATHFISILIKT